MWLVMARIPHNGYGVEYDGGNSTLVNVCANANDSDNDELTYGGHNGEDITSSNNLHNFECIDQNLKKVLTYLHILQ